jgi:antibiotic biosynthesis monooxygenase (ABM) superfamily enzyme
MNDRGSPEDIAEPVIVFTSRTIKPESEERFEAALEVLIAGYLKTEGHLGMSVMRPVKGTGSREYGIMLRFRDAKSRD